MRLTAQRRIAGEILGVSPSKIRFDSEKHEEIKEAITKRDIRGLIKEGAISKRTDPQQSKARARKIQAQKRKSQRKGPGSRKGTINSRVSRKDRWMIRIRAQRKLLRELREDKTISKETYADLYRKSSGGFFRSRRHINLYLDEHGLRQ